LAVSMMVLWMVNTVVSLVQLLRVFWRVVGVGVDHLRLYSQTDTCIAIFLDLLFTTPVTSCLFLVAMISGSAGAVCLAFCFHGKLLRLVPGPA
jgi:hypothetical protein